MFVGVCEHGRYFLLRKSGVPTRLRVNKTAALQAPALIAGTVRRSVDFRITAELEGEIHGYCNHTETGSEGWEFFAGIASAGGCVYAGGSYRRPEADWSDGGRVRGEGSAAAGQGFGEQKGRLDGVVGEEGRRARFDGRRRAGAVRRGGAGQDCDHGADGEAIDLWRFCRNARSACGNWHAANRLFWDRRTEEKIFAEAGDGRADWRVLFVRAAGRVRRAECADARGAQQRRHALHLERTEDVDHERRVRGCV